MCLRAMVSTCLPSIQIIFSSLRYSLRSLASHCFLGSGGSCRRQGKSAAPPGPACVCGWFDTCSCCFVRLRRSAESKRGKGSIQAHLPAPPHPAPPRSRGIAKMGGPGAEGLWRGLRRSPSVLALALARGRLAWWFARRTSPISLPMVIIARA